MLRRAGPVLIGLTLPVSEHRVFATAARRLDRIMGGQAPDIAGLMRGQLGSRSPAEIADDYLDSVRWPAEGTIRLSRAG